MVNLLCSIVVTVMAPVDKNVYIPWMVQVQAHGKLLKEGPEAYVVDFSKEAKVHKWVGDYGDRLVDKTMCVKL